MDLKYRIRPNKRPGRVAKSQNGGALIRAKNDFPDLAECIITLLPTLKFAVIDFIIRQTRMLNLQNRRRPNFLSLTAVIGMFCASRLFPKGGAYVYFFRKRGRLCLFFFRKMGGAYKMIVKKRLGGRL